MKRIYKFSLISLLGMIMFNSCSQDLLETSPTTAIATNEIAQSSGKAIAAIDGMYRLLYSTGYTSDWEHEEFGLAALNLTADLMGEDHVMAKTGSGWFWYDYCYNIKSDYTHNAGRPYAVWNFFYTLISNANYITAADKMEGSPSDVNYVRGQAFAIRGFSYFMLAQWYARTLVGHEDEPCVPIYTDPTTKDTKGKARETVAKVYEQVDSDLVMAERLLSATEKVRNSKSHLTLAEVYGLQARVAQVEENWEAALTAATNAIAEAKKEDIKIANVSQFLGLNSVTAQNVMWGVKIIADQSGKYASFFTHMDADMGKYGYSARQQISKSLYAKMGAKDERRVWWNPEDPANGENGGYQQEKFKFVNYQTWEGDYIFMRIEEMYLIKAEAECMTDDDAAAQLTLKTLIQTRDPEYTCNKTGKDLGVLTNELTGSLREEIINQRRIELWGEFGRIYDIRRLHQGFVRSSGDGHPSSACKDNLNNATKDPESYKWVMVIPQSEFDGNANMDESKDQNSFE